MAEKEILERLLKGVEFWNQWRRDSQIAEIDLTDAELEHADLTGADLSGVDLSEADLEGAKLVGANLRNANLSRAYLPAANLGGANLANTSFREAFLPAAYLSKAYAVESDFSRANLQGATLEEVNLSKADLSFTKLDHADFTRSDLSHTNLRRSDFSFANFLEANLYQADLTQTVLNKTRFEKAILTESEVYGISCWEVCLKDAEQQDLSLVFSDEFEIVLDHMRLAQFVYSFLDADEVQEAIHVRGDKIALIAGCFSDERKALLETMRLQVREWGYLPLLINFKRSSVPGSFEPISKLARLSRFLIVDVGGIEERFLSLKASQQFPSLPVVPLIQRGTVSPQAMDGLAESLSNAGFEAMHLYHEANDLKVSFKEKVIERAEAKVKAIDQKSLQNESFS